MKELGVSEPTFCPEFSDATVRLQIMKMLAGDNNRNPFYNSSRVSLSPYLLIWFPNTSKTSIGRLQIVQNAALRVALGCHLMCSIDHLHIETKTLPVLCARTLMPTHPSFEVVTPLQGPRDIKLTLKSSFHPFISQYLINKVMPPERYKQSIKDITPQ